MANSENVIPSQNSARNALAADVIGNKTDQSFSNSSATPSVIGHLKAGYYHVHSPASVYPTLADAVTVTADAAAWTLGAKAQIIPASTIAVRFDIHWVVLHNISADAQYELVLWKGAAESETEIGRIAFARVSNITRSINLPIQIPPQPANTRISASLASSTTNADTVTIKLYYHTYPDIT